MADTNERLQQAIAAARAGNIGEAKSMAEQLVDEDPNNPHALFLLGMLAEDQSEQIDYMEKVLSIDPNHKAANKRMDQLASSLEFDDTPEEEAEELAEPDVTDVDEEVAEAEVEEVIEPVAADEPEQEAETDDATIVAGAAAGAATAAVMDETMVSEPDATLGAQDEAFFDVSEAEVDEIAAEDAAVMEETVVSAAVIDDAAMEEASSEEAVEELPEEQALDETLPPGELTGGAVAAAAAAQNEEIPDWLLAEARTEEELVEFDETVLWGEDGVDSAEDLPDWLQEETAEEWIDEQPVEETVLVADTVAEETLVDDSVSDFEAIEETVDEPVASVDEPAEEKPAEEKPAVEQPKPAKSKKSSSRTLEIALGILIVIALLLVAGLAYAIISPPF